MFMKNFKKIMALVLVLVTIAAFATGCGKDDEEDQHIPDVEVTIPPLTEAPTEPEETTKPTEAPTVPTEPEDNMDKKYKKVDEDMYVTKDTALLNSDKSNAMVAHKVKFKDRVHRVGVSEDGWSAIKYDDEIVYIESKFLSKEKPADPIKPYPMYANKSTALREDADSNSKSLMNVTRKTKVMVEGVSGQWSKVVVNGKTGYILTKDLSKTMPSDGGNGNGGNKPETSFTDVDETVWVTGTDAVNVRKSPVVNDSNFFCKAKRNEQMHRTGKGNKWSRVDYKNETLYVASEYLTTKNPNPDKPNPKPDKPNPKPECDHNYKVIDSKEASCEASGFKTYKCSKCGKTYTDNISALGHDWSAWKTTKEATEKTEGKRERVCGRCNKIQVEVIPKKGHTHSYTTKVVAPTCTENGYTLHTCSCGDSYKSDIVPAKGHSWGDWKVTTKPTENQAGEETRQCKNCPAKETRPIDPIGPHSHNYNTFVKRVEPTCTEEGYDLYKCSCGATTKKNIVQPAHKFVKDHVVAPTCSEKGYTVYKCSACTATKKDNYTDTIPHTYGDDWTIVTKPEIGKAGLKQRVCTECGHIDKQTIPALVDPATCDHVWEEESREVTDEAGVRTDFIQHLVCHKCGSKDVKSGFEINEAKIAAFAGQTIAEVNKERSGKELNTVKIADGEAAAYTQRRANALVNDFSHNGMGGMYGGYHNQSENIAALPVGMASGYNFYASFRDSKEGHHEAMLSPNITYISVAFAHDDEYVYCAMEMFYRPADLIEQANDSVDEDPAAFNLLSLTDDDYENDPVLMQTETADTPTLIPELNDDLVQDEPVKDNVSNNEPVEDEPVKNDSVEEEEPVAPTPNQGNVATPPEAEKQESVYIDGSDWKVNFDYKVSNIVKFQNVKYKCIKAHVSTDNLTPAVAVELWTVIENESVSDEIVGEDKTSPDVENENNDVNDSDLENDPIVNNTDPTVNNPESENVANPDKDEVDANIVPSDSENNETGIPDHKDPVQEDNVNNNQINQGAVDNTPVSQEKPATQEKNDVVEENKLPKTDATASTVKKEDTVNKTEENKPVEDVVPSVNTNKKDVNPDEVPTQEKLTEKIENNAENADNNDELNATN